MSLNRALIGRMLQSEVVCFALNTPLSSCNIPVTQHFFECNGNVDIIRFMLETLFRVECVLSLLSALHVERRITPWFLVRKRTIPTERPQLAGEVSANFS
jgi:hypothetical protein